MNQSDCQISTDFSGLMPNPAFISSGIDMFKTIDSLLVKHRASLTEGNFQNVIFVMIKIV